jgi:cysteinyl-tRNA synthetase
MITINGRKMGKSYNNVIKLTELFSGNHPLLSQPFHPMTIRFFVLQSHYRSPLDFSNDALIASEKAFKRLWEAYEHLKKLPIGSNEMPDDVELDAKVNNWVLQFEEFMNDDFSTPKVIANMFEIAPVINSLKDGLIKLNAIKSSTLILMKEKFTLFLEEIFGLKSIEAASNEILQPVMELLLEIRKEAKTNKDFATSDKIRNQLTAMGIAIKDEKDGNTSWNII